jgi:predicted Zn-dependent protease
MGKKGVVKPKKASSFVQATDASKLVEQAQLALEKAEPELALKFFERAHSINNLDTSIMDSMADVLLQLDEPERAFSLLTRSIELEPQANPCKYLYLAQLQTNHEALASYRTGINFLSSERDGADPEVKLLGV